MPAARIRIDEKDLKDIKQDSALYKRVVDTLQEQEDGAVYLEYAQDRLHKDGALEFDDDSVVSLGADEGAYVMAWVWVADDTLRAEGYLEKENAET